MTEEDRERDKEFHETDHDGRWKNIRKKAVGDTLEGYKECFKEGIRLAEVKYQGYEKTFKEQDLKAIATITFCIAVIGFLLSPFLIERTLSPLLSWSLGIATLSLFGVLFAAAKVFRPKKFPLIGMHPNTALLPPNGEKEKENSYSLLSLKDMRLNTLREYECLLKEVDKVIKKKSEYLERSLIALVKWFSLMIGIASFVILQQSPFEDSCLLKQVLFY